MIGSPLQWKSTPCHVRLSWICEEADRSPTRVIRYSTTCDPFFDFLITHETVVCIRHLARTNYRSVSVLVIPIPQTHGLSICVTLQAFEKQFYSSSCVGGEDEVELVRISFHELQGTQPDRFDTTARVDRGRRSGVRVAIQVVSEVHPDFLKQ
jgi:hypothetical protein